MSMRTPAALATTLLLLTAVACGSQPATTVEADTTARRSATPSSRPTVAPSAAAATPTAPGTPTRTTTPTPAPTSAPPRKPEKKRPPAPKALRFDATTLDGGRFTASRLAGRPVALWFWAPWCPKCRREAPAVRKVAREFDGRIAFVGVAGKAETAQMKDFVRQYRLGDFPHVADANDPLWTRFEVPYQSSWVLLDQSGTVVHTGFLTEPELSTALEKLAA